MLLLNSLPSHNTPLDPVDAEYLGVEAAKTVARVQKQRQDFAETPLESLQGLARQTGVASIHIKDESKRLGLGSFKALGGSYAVVRLVLEEAAHKLGRNVEIEELQSPAVRDVAKTMTFGCATDGNHGKSVAAGAQMLGARAVIFVHSGVSDERVAAIAQFGANITRVEGTYDDSVKEAEAVCGRNGWIVLSDTSWPGYERIPRLVMQGYTAMLSEVLHKLPDAPTHVFVQAGVGGLAAAVAAHFDIVFGDRRPKMIVVEPDRAACIFESARHGKLTKVDHQDSTIMAMLECYEPSMTAWDVLSRKADAFQTVSESDAVVAMKQLAQPVGGDPSIVSGESGGAGLAGFLSIAKEKDILKALGITAQSRMLFFNTEGATDRASYQALVGKTPEMVLG